MPGFYPVDEYDLAGFAVGIVDKKDMITGEQVKAGDLIIGISSSGIHSNGYSLVRRVFRMQKEALDTYYESLGTTLGETLLTPTKIYVKALDAIRKGQVKIKACSHITGGGFYENIPRMLPEGMQAKVNKKSHDIHPIFEMLSRDGDISEENMYNTFNMGVGMALVVNAHEGDKTIELLKDVGEKAYIIGEIEEGMGGLTLC